MNGLRRIVFLAPDPKRMRDFFSAWIILKTDEFTRAVSLPSIAALIYIPDVSSPSLTITLISGESIVWTGEHSRTFYEWFTKSAGLDSDSSILMASGPLPPGGSKA